MLEYIPGCSRPAAVDLWADGSWQGDDGLNLLGYPLINNLAVWQNYVTVDAPLPELACWGHQVEDMPWEIA